MEVKVERFIFSKETSLGRVYINDELFCFSLEPYDAGITKDIPVEDIKALKNKFGKIAIPLGTYSMQYEWSNRYNKKMPKIMNIPGFDGVLWHPGNTVKDTRACLLPGKFWNNHQVSDSVATFNKFISLWKDEGFTPLKVTYTYGSVKQFV